MKCCIRLVLPGLLMSAFVFLAEAQDDGDVKAEVKKLQGTWRVMRWLDAGSPAADEEMREFTFRFDGDLLFMQKDKKSRPAKSVIKLNPAKNPKWIDMTDKQGALTLTTRGIYRLKDGELTLCIVQPGNELPRPTSFETKGKELHVLFVLKKAKD